MIKPANLTIILDCPEDICRQRIHKRSLTSDRADDHDEAIINKRFTQYKDQTVPAEEYVKSQQESMDFVVINSNQPIEKVYEEIWSEIEQRLKKFKQD